MIVFTESVVKRMVGLGEKHLNLLDENRVNMEPGIVTDDKVDREERVRVANQLRYSHLLYHSKTMKNSSLLGLKDVRGGRQET